MSQPPEPITAIGALGKASDAGIEIYKLAKELGLVSKLKSFLKKKKRILVLGSTGTGKTLFVRSFGNLIPEIINRASRTEFPTKHVFDFGPRLNAQLTDTPGQIIHASRRFPAIKEAMTRADGVINIVSYPNPLRPRYASIVPVQRRVP
jgi:hypothetical protein